MEKFKVGDLVRYYVDSIDCDGTYPSMVDIGVVVKCANVIDPEKGQAVHYLEVLWSDGTIVNIRHDDFTGLELINLS